MTIVLLPSVAVSMLNFEITKTNSIRVMFSAVGWISEGTELTK
jgi:hypothetical protein